MAETNMAEVLKQFAAKVTTSSVKERLKILEDLQPCVKKPDFPEPAVKGILKHLTFTLCRYHDKKSRDAVEEVIRLLVENHFNATTKHLLAILGDMTELGKNIQPCRSNSAVSMNALGWTCVVIRHGFKTTDKLTGENFNKMVELQAALTHGAYAGEDTSVHQGADNRMTRTWTELSGSVTLYLTQLLDSNPSIYNVCLLSCVLQYLSKKKQTDVIAKHRDSITDLYVKHVLGSRSRPQIHVLHTCKVLLRHLTHDNFKSAILPAVEKAMLRNPEVVLQVVCELIASVSLDLSQYVLELGKPLATQCCSKDELTQGVATRAVKNLAQQCSDSGAVEKLAKHLFAVLGGSEGKLSVAIQRVGVTTGIGNLSYNTVTGASLQSLATTVTEGFLPVLQQEVHEATLVHTLSMCSLWCSKFTTQVPDKLLLWFKPGMNQKSSTSAVRNAYIHCMSAAFHGDRLIQGLQILPLLVQAVEKAHAQPTQLPLVTEGLTAAALLAKMSLCDIQAESKLGGFWTVILDSDKQVFVNDKFLQQTADEALMCLASLVERLIMDHPQKLSEKVNSMYYRGLVYSLTHGSHRQRKHAKTCVTKMVSGLGGAKMSADIITEFRALINSQKVMEVEADLSESPEVMTPDPGRLVSPRVFTEAILCITNILSPEREDAQLIATQTLIDAHHPFIVHYNPDTWTDIVTRLGVDCKALVEQNINDIIIDVTNTLHISQAQCNAISTLTRISPKVVLPKVMELVNSTLTKPAMLTVTREEYEIMKTPPGELFNKSVIASGSKEEGQDANMRRENKLYSYKEQMAEIELRKELEKKKKAKGGGKEEPKLTKKQIEVMQEQLKKEAEIRDTCLELDRHVENMYQIICACIHGNPAGLRLELPPLLSTLMSLTQSPLASPRVTKVYVKLREIVFEEKGDQFFGLLVAYCSLRLMNPQCDLDPEWCEEPIKSQATRAVAQLHFKTVPAKGLSVCPQKRLSAPAFAFCFHLLRKVLDSGGKEVGGDSHVMQKALSIISAHAQLRDSVDNMDDASRMTNLSNADDVDECGPELLPREEMLSLCSQLISTNGGKLQQLATRALLDVAECASGQDGCTAALQPEIDVLLEMLKAPATVVREAGLLALCSLVEVLPTPDVDVTNGLQLVKRVWVSKFDVEDENRKIADRLWGEAELQLEPELCMLLVDDIVHNETAIREAAADAMATALETHGSYVDAVIQQILEMYEDKLYMPPPVLDMFGRVISEAATDQWTARSGIAMAIEKMAPLLKEDQVPSLFRFFVDKSLGDRHEIVRKHMLNAAVAAVNAHGKSKVSMLLPVFEDFLAQAPDTASFDAVRQSVVILMGSLAKHLDKDDPKVKPIVAKLIETLSTPSQQVQEAVANCLPPLVPAIKSDAPSIVHKLLDLLLESDNYGERRGAAYGLAGLVKGLGILALKQHGVMAQLTEAIQNKKQPKMREGALFAFEMLCVMLGRLFEPYVVHILPHLLLCFGDSNQFVREAADDCAKAVMSKLSAHGVKLILPSLLTALEQDSWRTKTGSVELLGAMAFCAPKQLSACLPNIVPKLTEVLTDSHLKVQKAGAQALKQIGSVIRNPEIQAIVPTLLEALQDPTKRTTHSLQCLLETKFVHFIDAPSLALIMPVVQRAFQDRSTETRKMAAQIIGNMYSLTDQKDLSPYLPAVIPGLKQSLLDPVPEVRTVAAKALGAMVKGMGETGFEELVPWLMQTLTSEQSTVDRSGAAQGLSEVVGGLGIEKLHKLMPDIIQTAERGDIAPHVRDGYIMMYIYLPTVFGDEFVPYVGPIIPSILQALADENEYVRDTALKSGQRIVNMYADTSIELLLPELEKGLFDDNWRIRSCSVQLLGDLLYKLSGVSGKMTTESAGEDDNFGTESSQQAILRVLGPERRNRVLAGLYMGRSDTALMVRQAALHVWKVIVTHTPKTLREILSTLFELLLGCLASTSYDKRQVAARTLGDIVRKLGEKVLPEIIPILEKGLDSDDSDQRQGVCIGLSEIMTSTSKDHVVVYADSLIPTVRKALIDPLPEVRESAAKTFDNLHTNIGSRALDEILPDLLKKLLDPDLSEFALDGLKQVMAVKSRVVLPYLVPQLTSKPVNTRALSFLSAVAGEALTKHLTKILPALLASLSNKMETEEEEQELGYCQAVVLSVQDEIGVRTVMDELLTATSHEDWHTRCAAVTILHVYCEQTKVDITEFVPQLFRWVVHLFIDDREKVLISAWSCLNAITKKLDTSEMLAHISNVRQAIKFAVSDLKGREELPGFCLPKKGMTPLLPIFREGLLNGPPEMKESAAYGLGELIRRTSSDALKPSVVNITGPLIRVLGDRFSFNVKVAVLDTLTLLLAKCGVMLKPFLPQLQTTFVKALNDPTRAVRLKAAGALGKLIAIHVKVDPLFLELHNGVKNAADASIRDTTLQALRGCIYGAGAKMSDKSCKELLDTLESMLSSSEDTTRTTSAACVGELCSYLGQDELAVLLNLKLLDSDPSLDWMLRHGHSVALAIALKQAANRLIDGEFYERVTQAVLSYASADRIPVSLSGLRGVGFLMRHLVNKGETIPTILIQALSKTMKKDSNDVKALASRIITYVCQSCDRPLPAATTRELVPMLVNGTKEKNSAVKSYSEAALVTLLGLKDGDQYLQKILPELEPGLQDSLNDVVTKALRKPTSQQVTMEDIDDTVLV